MWPNPAADYVQVRGAALTNAPVELLDAAGRVVRRQPATTAAEARLSLAGLAPGVYSVRAGAQVRRLVVR